MGRRIVHVKINYDVIESWLKSTGDDCVFHSVVGVPRDAKMINLNYDFKSEMFYALFEHESFEPVPAGNEIPVVTPVITIYYV